MLDVLIVLGGALYAGFRALSEDSDAAKAESAATLPVAAERKPAVPAASTAYAMLDEKKAGDYLQLAGAALGVSALALVFPPAGFAAVSLLTYLSLPLYEAATVAAVVERQPRSSMVGAVLSLASLLSGYYVLAAGCSLAFFYSFKLMLATQAKSRHRVARILGDDPREVWLAYGDAEVAVPFASLRAGDVIVLRAGELVPIDGTVVDGMASVDQRTLTGESLTVEKARGDAILASTTVVAGKLRVRVERAGEQTTVANIQRMLADTADYTAAVEQKAGQFCNRLAGPTLLAGGATALLLGPTRGVALVGCNLSEVNRATAPLSMLIYLDLSAERRILVKDGRSLELLSGIDTVIFDKTGTLTLDVPQVGRIQRLEALGEDEILRLAAAAGTRQPHPVARALVAAAVERGLALPPLGDASYEIGYGVRVEIDARPVHLGSARFMRKEGIRVADAAALAAVEDAAERDGASLAFVAQDGALVGAIELHDTVRPEAFGIVERLKARGMELCIVSGDAEAPTRRVAAALGIGRCHANVLPDEKAEFVRGLRGGGRSICFVGDGINDAVALKTADVGISLGSSSSIALDTAGIVLLDRHLGQLGALFELAADMERDRRRGYHATLISGTLGAVGVVFFGMGLPATLVLDMCGIGAALGAAAWPKLGYRSNAADARIS